MAVGGQHEIATRLIAIDVRVKTPQEQYVIPCNQMIKVAYVKMLHKK